MMGVIWEIHFRGMRVTGCLKLFFMELVSLVVYKKFPDADPNKTLVVKKKLRQ